MIEIHTLRQEFKQQKSTKNKRIAFAQESFSKSYDNVRDKWENKCKQTASVDNSFDERIFFSSSDTIVQNTPLKETPSKNRLLGCTPKKYRKLLGDNKELNNESYQTMVKTPMKRCQNSVDCDKENIVIKTPTRKKKKNLIGSAVKKVLTSIDKNVSRG